MHWRHRYASAAASLSISREAGQPEGSGLAGKVRPLDLQVCYLGDMTGGPRTDAVSSVIAALRMMPEVESEGCILTRRSEILGT